MPRSRTPSTTLKTTTPTGKPSLKTGKKKISKNAIKAGSVALAAYRKARAEAKAKGPKAYAEWEAAEKLKREQKKTTPMMAIKNFCVNCVATRADITNCTSYQCPLYIYRPYQKGEEE